LYEPWNETHGEIALCNLAGIIVSNIGSDEEYAEVAYYALKMIDKTINLTNYVFKSLEHTSKARMNAGVGILGLAHLMAKNDLKYSSQEGKNFIHELFETHYWHLLNASLKLGKELGNAPWMEKTLWPDGWLPIDTYEKRVDDLITINNKRDWDKLRNKIIVNKGIRNSILVAHMPGESSTIAAGTTNSVYPIRDFNLVKTSETMSLNYVVPGSLDLRDKYELAWDIPIEDMIDCYAIMQKWTDQAISADLWRKLQGNEKVGTREMIDNYLRIVKYGMKTRYYLNSLTAKGIDLNSSELETEEVGCSGGACSL
jgi:ribonucleoside-diphosphate reductase alpha chain